jgi:nucleoside 2-deoxyribosyltransferase
MSSHGEPMKLYLAGPMTGYVDHNYPMFFRAAAELRILGHEVANPAEIRPLALAKELTREQIMKEDIQLLLTCDAIAFLPNASSSQGAMVELSVARATGLDMHYVADLLGWSDSLLIGPKV